MELKIIEHGTAEYQEMVRLRMDLLRRPLGLSFTADQLASEKEDILLGAFEKDEMLGCCVLTAIDANTLQLRQMAVRQDRQSRQVGRTLLGRSEQIAMEKGFKILMMHARKTAVGFYEKCGYAIEGEEFTEVTIPHYYMEKKLITGNR